MSDKKVKEEKTYTAEEVAKIVLAKAHELLKNHREKHEKLAKANTSHEIEAGEEPNNDDAECPEYLANADLTPSKPKKKGDKHPKEPGHEMEMGEEEEMEHDAAENESDEMDDDVIEADEEENVEEIHDEDGDGDIDEDDAALKDKKKVIAAATGNVQKSEHQKGVAGPTRSKPGQSVSGLKVRGAKEVGGAPAKKWIQHAKEDSQERRKEVKQMPKPNLPKSEGMAKSGKGKDPNMRAADAMVETAKKKGLISKKPSLKKFMAKRKMKKALNADERAAAMTTGQPKEPQSLKEQGNKQVEKLIGMKEGKNG